MLFKMLQESRVQCFSWVSLCSGSLIGKTVSLICNSEFSLTNIPIYMRTVIKCKSYCFIFSRGQGISALGLEKSCLIPAHGADS